MAVQIKKLLYVFDVGPFSSSAGSEALEAALIGASFEQDISLLFLYDGVFQLKAEQAELSDALKQYTKAFRALEDFDIHNVYAHDQSLIARGLEKKDLMIDVNVISSNDTRALIASQDKVFTF